MYIRYDANLNINNKNTSTIPPKFQKIDENIKGHQMHYSETIPKNNLHRVQFFDNLTTQRFFDNPYLGFGLNTLKEEPHSYNDGKFTDHEFPPCAKSIGDLDFCDKNRYVQRRVESLCSSTPSLFEHGINATDLVQGSLGDCQILAAFSCLTVDKRLIQNIFLTKKINREGRYELRMFKRGMPCRITIDSQVPVDRFTNKPYGVSCTNNLVQAPLLEKGFAKLKGSYQSLKSGECHDAFQDLTGNPSYQLSNPHQIINQQNLLSNLLNQGNHLLTAAIDSRISGHEANRVNPRGLLTDHAYSALKAQEFNYGDGREPLRLVLLRNPQGKREQKGDQSDNSPKQTPELVRFYKLKRNPYDGEFQMSHNEFMNNFDTYSACDCSKNQKTNRQATYFKLHSINPTSNIVMTPSYRFEVPKNSTTNQIAVHQQDPRSAGARPVLDIGALILKEPNLECVGYVNSQLDRQAQDKLDLPPGSYQLHLYSSGAHFAKNDLSDSNINRKATITLHSQPKAPVKLEELPHSSQMGSRPIDPILTSLLDRFCRPKLDKENPLTTIRPENCKRNSEPYNMFMKNMGALIVTGIENKPDCTKWLSLEMDPSHSKNLLPAIDSQQGLKPKTMILPPGNKGVGMVILGKYVRVDDNACKFGCKVNFKFLDSPPSSLSNIISFNPPPLTIPSKLEDKEKDSSVIGNFNLSQIS